MPFTRIRPGELRHVAVPALVVWLLAFLPFLLVGEPSEMMRLQLAGSESQARAIVSGWTPSEVVDMAYLQGIDAVHPLAYGIVLAAAAVWAGRRFRGRAARWAAVIVWMPVAAAVFDTLENIGMIVMIRGDTSAPIPMITTTFAVAKFSMFIVVAPYVVSAWVANLRGRRAVRAT